MTQTSTPAYDTWQALQDEEITPDIVSDVLGSILDDVWAAAACVDRLLDDTSSQRSLLLHGIARTDRAVLRCQELTSSITDTEDLPSLLQHLQDVPADGRLCQFRAILLRRLDRLNSYVEMEKVSAVADDDESSEEEIDEWEDDPWADEAATTKATPQTKIAKLPVSLSTFLIDDIAFSAQELASLQYFNAVKVLFERHASELWPSRFVILDAIPEHAIPSTYRQLLPALDISTNLELTWHDVPWRTEDDFSEAPEFQSLIQELGLGLEATIHAGSSRHLANHALFTGIALCDWYSSRVDRIVAATGIVDAALAVVQYGASQGVPGLDELGEELSLFSRLVYDTPKAYVANDNFTIAGWKTLSPRAVLQAYLAHSTPETLGQDISRLVMPYLYVLEARAERSGSPDPELPNRVLYDYVLSIPLELAAAVFEASKPTLPSAQRILRNDEDTARLALACLYGSDSLNEWSTMSRIFECMPAWDATEEDDTDEEAADTTISSLGNFVTPSTSRSNSTAKDLQTFFKPLTIRALSRALDILDIHLESGEILARWNVAAPLRWFLRSHDDINEQRAWANRMARQAGGTVDPLTTQEDWEWLLEDMLKLTETNESGLRGAFGLLTREEIYSIYLSGLLSTGKFDIAKAMLRGTHPKIPISQVTIEEICLKCSNELYDNSSSGNYKIGDMKLAYDCLDVAPSSKRIQLEKDFIEATSRISSFNVMSRGSLPISPIEIRLTKDRLSLVSQVLSSNSDAYKHTEVVLDLTHKLGFRDDVSATVKALAMLAETALQAEDFMRAYENTQRMVAIIYELQASQNLLIDDTKLREAIEVCWIACFQLGRQPEYPNLANKIKLLGQALDLCPTDKVHDVLNSWRKLQKEDIEIRKERLGSHQRDIIQSARPMERGGFIPRTVASSLRARLHDLHMPSPPLLSTPDAAALATRTFKTVASNFPFSIGHRSHSAASEERTTHSDGSWKDTEDVSSQASRALSKGIGWLIGADDE